MNARIEDFPLEPEYDDDDIDWDDIIATTQDDVDAGRYAFTTEGYATDEEGMAALWQWMCTLGQGGSDETSDSAADTASA
jgi:hypothetical protein